jgi:hypothetical protein
MWIFTAYCFLSVVEDRRHKNRVCVRARCAQDLDTFRTKYCSRLGPTIKAKGAVADYPCRAFVGKQAFANAMGRVAMDIDYTNYKSRVTQTQGWTREGVYMRVWGLLRDAQSRGDFDLLGDDRPPVKESVRPRWDDDRPSTVFDRNGDRLGGTWENGPTYRPQKRKNGPTEWVLDKPLPDRRPARALPPEAEDPFFWQDGDGHRSDDRPRDSEAEGTAEGDFVYERYQDD